MISYNLSLQLYTISVSAMLAGALLTGILFSIFFMLDTHISPLIYSNASVVQSIEEKMGNERYPSSMDEFVRQTSIIAAVPKRISPKVNRELGLEYHEGLGTDESVADDPHSAKTADFHTDTGFHRAQIALIK